jgi:hypothetical protein
MKTFLKLFVLFFFSNSLFAQDSLFFVSNRVIVSKGGLQSVYGLKSLSWTPKVGGNYEIRNDNVSIYTGVLANLYVAGATTIAQKKATIEAKIDASVSSGSSSVGGGDASAANQLDQYNILSSIDNTTIQTLSEISNQAGSLGNIDIATTSIASSSTAQSSIQSGILAGIGNQISTVATAYNSDASMISILKLIAKNTTQNAYTLYKNTALSNTAITVKSSAGNVYGIRIINPNASAVYVKFYNSASVTVGTTAPIETIQVKASDSKEFMPSAFPINYFSNSIKMVCTANLADSDATAPGTGVFVEIKYN